MSKERQSFSQPPGAGPEREARWERVVLPQLSQQDSLCLPAAAALLPPVRTFPDAPGSFLRLLVLADLYMRYARLQGQNAYLWVLVDNLCSGFHAEAARRGLPPSVYLGQARGELLEKARALGVLLTPPEVLPTGTLRLLEAQQRLFLDLRRARALTRRRSLPSSVCEGCRQSLALVPEGHSRCPSCGRQLAWAPTGPWLVDLGRFSEEGLTQLKNAAWPAGLKNEQRHLIGRKSGLSLTLKIGSSLTGLYEDVEVFLERPEYLLAAAFLFVRFDHPALNELADSFYREELEAFCTEVRATPPRQRGGLRRKAVFTGIRAINPITTEHLPVLASAAVPFGLDGAVGVPGYCREDREVACRLKLPQPLPFGPPAGPEGPAPDATCRLSGPFYGESIRTVRERISETLIHRGVARREVRSNLRHCACTERTHDGVPVPLVRCQECGEVAGRPPVLPRDSREQDPWFPSPQRSFSCPKCGKAAEGFDGSLAWGADLLEAILAVAPLTQEGEGNAACWAFLPREKRAYPLLRSRLFAGFLRKRYPVLPPGSFAQVILAGPVSADAEKILHAVKQWGTDTVRLALLSAARPEAPLAFSESTLRGVKRLLGRVRRFSAFAAAARCGASDQGALAVARGQMVYRVVQALEHGKPHLAVASMGCFLSQLLRAQHRGTAPDERSLATLAVCLAPFAPYHAAELYACVKQGVRSEAPQEALPGEAPPSVFDAAWPPVPEKLPREPEVEVAVFFEGRPCDRFSCPAGSRKQDLARLALSSRKVQERLGGRKAKYIFTVPDYLVNVVPKAGPSVQQEAAGPPGPLRRHSRPEKEDHTSPSG